MIADLPSDWAVWSVDQPVERREFYCWLREMMATPLPADRRLEAFVASSAPPKRRERKPSLKTIVKQLFKAGQAAGVSIAVTIEGDKVTASPARGIVPANRDDRAPGEPPANSDVNEWDADLGTNPPSLRQ